MMSELVKLAANLSEGRRGEVVSVSTDRAAELLASGLAESPSAQRRGRQRKKPVEDPVEDPVEAPTVVAPSFLTATED